MATDHPEPDTGAEGTGFRPNAFGQDTRHDFHVLKDGDLFALFSPSGAINAPNAGASEARSKDGLFFRDTRYLSRLVWYLNGTPLTEMGHSALHAEAGFRSDLANTRLVDRMGREVPDFQIHMQLDRFLSDGLFDRIRITNHALTDVELDLVLDIWADFRDLFEVRGVSHPMRGELQPPVFGTSGVDFAYTASDGRHLSTGVHIDPPPQFDSGRARITLSIPPKTNREITCVVRVSEKTLPPDAISTFHGARHGAADLSAAPPHRDDARAAMAARCGHRIERTGGISSSRPNFDAWLARSSADLSMLTSELSTGPYPYAGVPWFSAPFGRDGIIAALQTLWLDPELAAGVLDFLSATQATGYDPFRDAAPGKILHEHRNGEMARTGVVAFHHYYGGIDQTLLFLILARAYWARTGDQARIARLEPSLRAALAWASNDADRDKDGFIEYQRLADTGLRNQGWKDSDDSVFHADGTLADGPIALIEVQGYHVAALRAAADLFGLLGSDDEARRLRDRADDLVEKIDTAFWDDDLGSFCLALDGDKTPTRVSASNAGHLLFCDAVLKHRRSRLIDTLRAPELRSGWGLRTLSTNAVRYNPMGYHNGSVWPHDTSIIAAGIARSGDRALAATLTDELFAASCHFPEHRLPELWCGFSRSESDRPVAFPSACAPQAWSAGAPFQCLQACLGLTINAPEQTLHLDGPVLPTCMDRLDIGGLRIGKCRIDLQFERTADGKTSVRTLNADPGIRVEIAEA